MATYAIGDVQGCYHTLCRLLERVRFDPVRDRLLFAGDLVNRGPRSLETLRFVRSLGDRAVAVLGNHDMFLIALAGGMVARRRRTTVDDVLGAPDCEELVAWLLTRPLFHREPGWALVHAGLLPSWSIARAESLAREVEAALSGALGRALLGRFVGQGAPTWSETLRGGERIAAIASVMTTVRACTPEGAMHTSFTGPPADIPHGFSPWYTLRRWFEGEDTILFGHWASMGFVDASRYVALDSGCVWGGSLTAFRLEDRAVFHEPLAD